MKTKMNYDKNLSEKSEDTVSPQEEKSRRLRFQQPAPTQWSTRPHEFCRGCDKCVRKESTGTFSLACVQSNGKMGRSNFYDDTPTFIHVPNGVKRLNAEGEVHYWHVGGILNRNPRLDRPSVSGKDFNAWLRDGVLHRDGRHPAVEVPGCRVWARFGEVFHVRVDPLLSINSNQEAMATVCRVNSEWVKS